VYAVSQLDSNVPLKIRVLLEPGEVSTSFAVSAK